MSVEAEASTVNLEMEVDPSGSTTSNATSRRR